MDVPAKGPRCLVRRDPTPAGRMRDTLVGGLSLWVGGQDREGEMPGLLYHHCLEHGGGAWNSVAHECRVVGRGSVLVWVPHKSPHPRKYDIK